MSGPQSGTREAAVDHDRELVRDIAQGSAEALSALYDRHVGVVLGIARRLLSLAEDAEEVVQDVFAQVWRSAARYDGSRGTVAAWLVVLARTRAIDRLRARRARPDQDQSVDAADAPLKDASRDPEASAVSADAARRVNQALESLPATQRDLVELAYFQGLTHSEIAGRSGVPLGTVKTRLRTAMATLREALSGRST